MSIICRGFLATLLASAGITGCFDLTKSSISGNQSPCTVCTEKACAKEIADCTGDEECGAYYDCVKNCGSEDVKCRIDCVHLADENKNMVIELGACQSTKCTESCEYFDDAMFDGRGLECSLCVQEKCKHQAIDCARDPDCYRVMTSRYNCRDPLCFANDGLGFEPTRQILSTPERDAIESCLPDCAAECRLGTDLSCNTAYDLPSAAGATRVDWTPISFTNRNPIGGVDIELWLSDEDSEPYETSTIVEPGDYFASNLTSRFTGWVLAQKKDHIDVILVSSRPFVGHESWQFSMLSDAMVKGLSQGAGIDLDEENTGVIGAVGRDCTGTQASGIVYEIEGDQGRAQIVYTNGWKLDWEAKQTDDSGTAIIFNAPVGTVILTAKHAATDTGISIVAVRTRPGTLTWVALFPSPK